MNPAITQLALIVEKLGRPGVLGAPGRRLEKAVRREVEAYFAALSHSVLAVGLESLITVPKGDLNHAVTQRLYNPLRLNRTRLLHILMRGLMAAVTTGWKQDHRPRTNPAESAPGAGTLDRRGRAGLGRAGQGKAWPGDARHGKARVLQETDDTDFSLNLDATLDQLGLTAQKAADFAATQAAELVVKIDNTTRERIAKVISTGIEDQLGVPGTARLLRSELADMSVSRSAMIAATEINDAFTFAALTKMKATEIEYKRLILSPDACPICEENEAEGPIPVDQDFGSGDDGPPFHPLCRCAVTGARAPEEDEEDDEE